MKKVLVAISICCGISFSAFAQYGGDYEYSREFVWGITKATNSGLIGGLMVRHSRSLSEDVFHGFGLEIVNIKHPQEQKFVHRSTGSAWIFGKSNYLYSIRLSYGREKVLFRKAPQQGVQINARAMIGPTFGLEVPYYVEVADGNRTKQVPYEEGLADDTIIGGGSFLRGFGDTKLVPGLNTKLSMAFEFGTYRSNVVGLEVGFQMDVFTRDIILIPTANNSNMFPNAFLTLFYGGRK